MYSSNFELNVKQLQLAEIKTWVVKIKYKKKIKIMLFVMESMYYSFK